MRFAEEGARVVATSRRAAGVVAVCEEIEHSGSARPIGFELDVTDEDATARVVSAIEQELGHIDVVVSNAGIELLDEPSIADTASADWHRVLGVNLTGAFHLVRACWPHFGQFSSVITIGSLNSFGARAGAGAYAASKGGLLQFTRAIALELAPRGGRANCVCPGNIDTP